jgi:hypothetical protein
MPSMMSYELWLTGTGIEPLGRLVPSRRTAWGVAALVHLSGGGEGGAKPLSQVA